MKSFYLVKLDLTGGVYRDDQFVYGSLAELQQALECEFWGDLRDGMGCLLSYDDIPLSVYIAGREKQKINLRPFVTIHGPDGVTFRLPENGLVCDYVLGEPVIRGTDSRLNEAFIVASKPSLDWGAVPLPPLEEPVAEDGEEVEYEQEYQGETSREVFRYGYFNMEGGEDDDADFRERMEEVIEIDPDWLEYNGGAVRALAKSMWRTGDYSAMPVLADALEEAGCENELILWHCRSPAGVHGKGSWLVERIRR